jgi:hypothetical protein
VNATTRLGLLGLAVTLSACSVLESDKIDYKSATKGASLEVPPDLSQLSRDTRYTVPGGVVSAAAFEAGQAQQPRGAANAAPQAIGDVRIERDGNQRWLVVDRPADQLWEPVRDFWLENGFVYTLEQPNLGLLETDWAENRAKLPQDIIRSTIGKVFDSLYSTGERDKFRTRLERASDGRTEIYVSHRGMVEVYSTAQKDSTIWQPRPADPELETEFLGPHGHGERRAGGAARREFRPCMAPRGRVAGPHRVHRGRPRPQPGRVLRALCRAHREEGTGLLQQALRPLAGCGRAAQVPHRGAQRRQPEHRLGAERGRRPRVVRQCRAHRARACRRPEVGPAPA